MIRRSNETMYTGKLRYIERLTPRFRSAPMGSRIDGTSPPGVFIGRAGYPRVFVGPLVTATMGDTMHLDTPERWLPAGRNARDIAAFRVQLARGMEAVTIRDLDHHRVSQIRDIALAKRTVLAAAEFASQPRGVSFSEYHQPFGPSAPLKELELENVPYEHRMEKAYHDTDLKAGDAVLDLYRRGLLVTALQKALSVGAFGLTKNRKLVPTRWSITAVDDTIGKDMLARVKMFEPIDAYRVYSITQLNNTFVSILTPTPWKYESMEAFFRAGRSTPEIFSDYEYYDGRTTYAQIGGCYYAAKLAVLERLAEERRQAGCIILRECYEQYMPLGVWNVRENMRMAVAGAYTEHATLRDALAAAQNRLRIPINRWIAAGHVLAESLAQRRITEFAGA